jgi:hypothetical protein
VITVSLRFFSLPFSAEVSLVFPFLYTVENTLQNALQDAIFNRFV